MTMERRAFVTLAGLSAASLATGGMLSACDATGAPTGTTDQADTFTAVGERAVSFSSDVDVVIVGSGVAGLSAAMAPLEAGRSVQIVEKLDLLGGESYQSNGVMYVADSAVQQQAGVKTTVDEAWSALEKNLGDMSATDRDFAKVLYTAGTEWANHLVDEYGVQFADPAAYAQGGTTEFILLPKTGLDGMETLMVPLRDGLAERGATFTTGHRAKALIVSEKGEVCGVRFAAAKGEATLDVRARCVVIATGGFSSSQPLMHEYLPAQEYVGCCTTASMGEGLALCAGVGGQFANMDKAPSLISDIPQAAAWGLFGPTLVVNAQGQRFAREDVAGAAADACWTDELGFWWTVFDGQLGESGQSRSLAQVTNEHATRLVGPFDSLSDLAAGMGIPVEKLEETWKHYEGLVKAGKDEDFGRELFLKKLEAPFYALKQFPVRYRTIGGVSTDKEGRALNGTGTPIPHLYCCGAAAGGVLGGLAASGAYGMIAGQAAAKDLENR
ncbi:succinate dehydrogenase [Eggerthella sp. YY7918]|nr:FAD-dependent oxidoreductase [Eggerthella sp. YY7918]BAK45641.1 succinate dehydrogenase [Eggerthella sp. YY7918]